MGSLLENAKWPFCTYVALHVVASRTCTRIPGPLVFFLHVTLKNWEGLGTRLSYGLIKRWSIVCAFYVHVCSYTYTHSCIHVKLCWVITNTLTCVHTHTHTHATVVNPVWSAWFNKQKKTILCSCPFLCSCPQWSSRDGWKCAWSTNGC